VCSGCDSWQCDVALLAPARRAAPDPFVQRHRADQFVNGFGVLDVRVNGLDVLVWA